MRDIYKNLLRLFFGLAVLGLVVYLIGPSNIYRTLVTLNVFYIPLFFLLLTPIFFMSAFNIKAVLKSLGYNVKYNKILKYFSLAWSLGAFTPIKLGEFSLGYFLRKDGVPLGCTTAILLMDRLVTLFIISGIAVIAFNNFLGTLNIFTLILLLLIFSVFIFFVFSNKGRYLIRRFVLRKYSREFEGFSKCLFHYLKHYKLVLLIFFIALSRLFFMVFLIYMIFFSFGTHVPFFSVALVNSLITIIAFIPITINGLGTSEAASLFFYSLLGIGSSVILSVSIISAIVGYSSALFLLVLHFGEFIELRNYFRISKSKLSLKNDGS